MKKLFWTASLSLCLAACHGSTDGIAGTYGVEERGKVEPLFKVEAVGNAYTLSEYHAGSWTKATSAVKPFTKVDLEQLTKHKIDVSVNGIQTNSFALIQVPKGWSDGRFTTKTGYFAFILFGPVELQKL